MSTDKLPIGKIERELDPEVRKILEEFYIKKCAENDAELARMLDIKHSSTVQRWREKTAPGWVLLYIWQTEPRLLRDKIIDRATKMDPTHDLTEDDAALVRDFAEMLKNRRARELNPAEIAKEIGHDAIDQTTGGPDTGAEGEGKAGITSRVQAGRTSGNRR